MDGGPAPDAEPARDPKDPAGFADAPSASAAAPVGQPVPTSSPPQGIAKGSWDAVPAQRLIFWLFVVLAVCTAAILLWFIGVSEDTMAHKIVELEESGTVENVTKAQELRDALPGVRFRLHAALAGDLAAPVIAWFILKGIADRPRRAHWLLVSAWAGLASFTMVLLLLVAAGRVPLA